MDITINVADGVPIYRQIVNQAKYLVASGLLQAGEELTRCVRVRRADGAGRVEGRSGRRPSSRVREPPFPVRHGPPGWFSAARAMDHGAGEAGGDGRADTRSIAALRASVPRRTNVSGR